MGSHEVVQFRFSVAISITTTAAFLAMTIGVFSPAWFVVQRNGVQISEGPWYTRACPLDSGDCVISTRELIYGLHSDGRGDSALIDDHWLVIKIELTTAIGLVCVGLGFAALALIKRKSPIQWILIAGGLCLLPSSILSLVAVLKVISVSENLNTAAPWSRDVTFAGSIAAFCTSCLYVFAISQSCMMCIKMRRLKRQSSVFNHTEVPVRQGRTIQFILLDNLQSADSSYLRGHGEGDLYRDTDIPGKYPNQPPAYSEIYGENATI